MVNSDYHTSKQVNVNAVQVAAAIYGIVASALGVA